ncbi:MAG: SpoIIE family protein phosphatase [Parvicellaceae bacterium]
MKKHLLFLLAFLFFSNVFFSQTKLDSALNMMSVDSIHDTIKMQKLYSAISDILYSNPDSVIILSDIAIEKVNSSIELLDSSENEILTKTYYYSTFNNSKGIAYYLLNRRSESLDMFVKNEKIARLKNDTNSILRCNNNIAVIKQGEGKSEEAFKIFKENKKLYTLVKDTGGIMLSNLNLASSFNTDSSIILMNEIISLHKKYEYESILANVYSILYSNYSDTSSPETMDYEKAMQSLDSLFHYANKQSDFSHIRIYYSIKSDINFRKNQYYEALKNAEKAAKIDKEMTGLRSPEILSQLFEIHKKLKNYKKAIFYLEEMVENKDSLEKLSAKEDITKYESEKEFELKQKLDSLKHLDEIRIQQAETKAKEEEIKTQKIIEAVLFVGILLVIGFLGFVYKQLNTTKKQKLVIEEKQEEITDSINYAKRIQDAMMTSSVYLKDTLPKSFIFFKPKDVVSGDFYWIYKDQEENIFFTVADCTGHGVPGAFMSMIGTSLLNEIIIEKGIKETDKILIEMRAQIIRSLSQEDEGAQKDGMDISLCKLNMKKKTVEFSGAHNSLIHVRGEELKTYRGDHQPVGLLLGEKKPFTKHQVKLKKDDMLYIYSDGYQDQFGGAKGKKYMAAKFKKQLLKMSNKSEDQQLAILDQEFSSWKNDYEQIDDVCVMGVRIT